MSITNRSKRIAFVDAMHCVACGCCMRICPTKAIKIKNGIYADVDSNICVGCGKCSNECPASVIEIKERT